MLTLSLEHPIFLTVETTFAVLNKEHPQCNELLECLTSHICADYRDFLIQIRNDFSSKSLGQFAESYKKLGDRLSIYKYNDSEFVLLDSRQIIPPPGAVPLLLKSLHTAHVGIERTVRLTKQLFFWKSMLKDLTTTISSCKACQLYAPSQKRKTIQSHAMTEAAFSFQECAADLFSLNGHEYIATVARLTGFICWDKVTKTSTSSITVKLTNWLNLLRWLETIRTDGGPQFRQKC